MNIALIGYGRMGREIEKILQQRGHRIALVIDESNRHELTVENLRGKQIDVAIEFTTPQTAFDNVSTCLRAGVGVVCGTTGWLARYEEAVALCEKLGGTFFYASNYSVGVNVFFRINETLARMMNAFPEYSPAIEEIHHIHKKDAPSGTAITLAEGIIENTDVQRWVCGVAAEREVSIASERTREVPGTHTVTWESAIDRITITHEAKNRLGLAMGAVLAAEYIHGKTGVFSMSDMLGI